MPDFTREYPNGSIAYLSGGCGTLARLENVPRLTDVGPRSLVSGKWSYEDGKKTFLGFEMTTYSNRELHECDMTVLNRHSFNVRHDASGDVSYPGKYYLAYGELMGGWYLL